MKTILILTISPLFILFGNLFVRESKAQSNNEKLIDVVIEGDSLRAMTLLKKGVDVNEKDNIGKTALRYAVEKQDAKIVKLLLKYGADPNARDKHNNTPLMYLASIHYPSNKRRLNASWGRHETIEALLSAGADVNIKGEFGHTPLMNAIINDHTGMIKLLLKHGANPNLIDSEGCTALMHAVGYRRFSDCNTGVELGELQPVGETSRTQDLSSFGVNLMGRSKADAERMYNYSLGPYLCYHYLEVVKLLLTYKAWVNIKAKDESRALTWAMKHDCKWHSCEDIVKLLKKHGAKE